MPRNLCLRVAGAVGLAFLTLFAVTISQTPPAGADTLLVRTEPAGNSVVTASPQAITLDFSQPVNAAGSTVAVFSADHAPRAAGAHVQAVPDNPNALTLALPALPKGTYTVVWSADGADGAIHGVFAFGVDPSGSSPIVAQQPQPIQTLSPLPRVVTKWLAFVMIMTFVGAAALRLLVTLPVLSRLAVSATERADLIQRTDRAVVRVAGGAVLLFLPATLGQLVYESGAAAKVSFAQSFTLTGVVKYLTHVPAGHYWALRLGLTLLLAIAVLPLALASFRRCRQERTGLVTLLLGFGLACAAGELLLRTLPANLLQLPASALPRTVFTSLLDWAHLLGAAIWVGGLVALLLLLVTVHFSGPERGVVWPPVIRRFSKVALLSVASMIPTGLWTAWIHVGTPSLLLTTVYGRALLAKLCLVGLLVLAGVWHQLWLLPRLEAARRAGDRERAPRRTLLRSFRRMLALEVLIGLAILFIVPFLSGSARNQAFQAKTWSLKQSAVAGGLPVTLQPSAIQPGLTNYDVTLPHDVKRVALRFAAPELAVPATDVVAVAEGKGLYRVVGMYTPMLGAWQVDVAVTDQGATQTATFRLPIQAKAVAQSAPPPVIRRSTWIYGSVEVLLVLLAVAIALRVSRLAAARYKRPAVLPREASPQ